MSVSYRSVALALIGLFALVLLACWFIAPTESHIVAGHIEQFAFWAGNKVGLIDDSSSHKQLAAGPQQAHFTAIDGTVRVKKSGANSWVTADYSQPLERGDVVQTGAEGLARVVFADGSSYTVKQDSLIVVDDNSVNASQQTNVAVQVTSGTIDLTTGSFAQGSRSQVKMAGATASFAPDTSAQVRNNPTSDSHEVLVKKGSGTLQRNGEAVQLSEYERVSFVSQKPGLTHVKELGPPSLIAPSNTAVLFSDGPAGIVNLSWQPNERAKAYRVRVSKNDYFTASVLDTKVRGTQLVAKLPAGEYYWMVQSIDGAGRNSIDSEHNKFSVMPRSKGGNVVKLEIDEPQLHGRLMEIRGHTEPGAQITINGRVVPFVASDGSFAYLTESLPSGPVVFTVTAQNSKGGIKSRQVRAVIE